MDPTEAFTIEEFCRAYRFSRASYFKLKKEGRGPRELRIGKHVVISRDAAAEWCRERESEVA